MLYSHVTLLMLRVIDIYSKQSVQQSTTRMLVAEIPGDIQVIKLIKFFFSLLLLYIYFFYYLRLGHYFQFIDKFRVVKVVEKFGNLMVFKG